MLTRTITRPGEAPASFSLRAGKWVETTPSSVLHTQARTPAQLPLQREWRLATLLQLGLLNIYRDALFLE
eukprot:COSAG01_NODE_3218_length_6398_cov_5.380695_6_plen_70_part_00